MTYNVLSGTLNPTHSLLLTPKVLYVSAQSLDELPEKILKMVVLRALSQWSVRDQQVTQHMTTIASLSSACYRAVGDVDIRRRIKRGRKISFRTVSSR